ncbi:hypothetical protein QUC31_017331, partial [Theobroma cacao]
WDLYLPTNRNGPKPVVVFVTGGAWIIGYKAWGSLLGLQLAERDIIVACVDYRNFPQGTISDMVKDVSQGISFVCNIIGEYGGGEYHAKTTLIQLPNMRALLTLFLLLSALLFSASSIAAQSIGSKGGGGSGSGTPVTGNRPPAAVPCRGRPFTSCIPKPPKKCNTPFQGDCP